jgi:hypothetical protein
MIQYGVILFYTTSAVMRAEKLLNKGGFSTRLIPTPRKFSSDCGIALRFEWDCGVSIKTTLDTAHVEYNAVHLLDKV